VGGALQLDLQGFRLHSFEPKTTRLSLILQGLVPINPSPLVLLNVLPLLPMREMLMRLKLSVLCGFCLLRLHDPAGLQHLEFLLHSECLNTQP
jgi:hypothetical protein